MPKPVNRVDLGWRTEQLWSRETSLDLDRQLELERLREQNVAAQKPPMDGVKLERADVEWLIEQNGGPIHYGDDYSGRPGLDLRQANLMDGDFSRLPLADTLLQGARTDNASFEGSDLRWAYFDNAHMSETRFGGADIFKGHFEGTYLREANFRGCNLRGAWFNESTYLDGVQFDRAGLSGCHWRSVDVSRVDWDIVRVIGDEVDARKTKFSERSKAFSDASDAYGRVSQLLRAQGRLSNASRFYYRRSLMHRKSVQNKSLYYFVTGRWWRLPSALFSLVGNLLLEMVSGYGEQPGRVLGWAISIVAVFTALYMNVGDSAPHQVGLSSAVVLSITSLLGRGYGLLPSTDALAKPISLLSAIEGGIGTTLELLFVTTFTRRLLGS